MTCTSSGLLDPEGNIPPALKNQYSFQVGSYHLLVLGVWSYCFVF